MNRKLTFTITETAPPARTHRIMELCEHLTTNVLRPLFIREGVKWEPRFMDFFTFDNTCDPLEAIGTIRFAVPPLFAGRERELESALQGELGRLGIKTGPFTRERDARLKNAQTIVISITENPTALLAPPEVNMSQTRGCVVMRDLLGYQKVNGRYEFAPKDLLQRVSLVTEERIAVCTASPVRGAGGVQRTPSPASASAVRRCLEEIRRFSLWALAHNCGKLAAA